MDRQLKRARPGVEQTQLASEALELALKQIGTGFSEDSEAEEGESPSLDEAIRFVRQKPPRD